MPNTPILSDSPGVAALAAELAREQVVAVDLEADSMHSYQDKVCLLQVTTPSKTVLIDPLADVDLTPLHAVLADPSVRKIFHAADYDIRCLHRDFNIQIRGLFDTMIASQFVGEEKVGLADVLGKYFNVTLDKKFQRADWSQRPLSGEMIAYAAEDTRHLHRLAELLEKRLEEKGRLSWAAEEFALMEQVKFQENNGPLFLRVKGAGTLDRRSLAVLEELLQWRDQEAQRRDRPPFKVVGNRELLEVARTTPANPQALSALKDVPQRVAERYGRVLLMAVQRGMELPDSDLPVYPRGERPERDPQAEKLLKLLKEWRIQISAELEMDPGIVINNALLEDIARRRPRDMAALRKIDGLKNWQAEALGEGLLGVVNGK